MCLHADTDRFVASSENALPKGVHVHAYGCPVFGLACELGSAPDVQHASRIRCLGPGQQDRTAESRDVGLTQEGQLDVDLGTQDVGLGTQDVDLGTQDVDLGTQDVDVSTQAADLV